MEFRPAKYFNRGDNASSSFACFYFTYIIYIGRLRWRGGVWTYIGSSFIKFVRTAIRIKNCSGPQMERFNKRLQKVFKSNGLDVIIECNMKTVNYLDVTFNFNDGTYRPYHKTDNITQCIYVESNHPPNIMKQIPKRIEKHLSQLSSNEKNIQWINTLLWRQTTPVWLPTKIKVQPSSHRISQQT